MQKYVLVYLMHKVLISFKKNSMSKNFGKGMNPSLPLSYGLNSRTSNQKDYCYSQKIVNAIVTQKNILTIQNVSVLNNPQRVDNSLKKN